MGKLSLLKLIIKVLLISERTGASLVENLITKYSYFDLLIDFYVYDLTENLDHCAISFVIDIDCIHVQSDVSQNDQKMIEYTGILIF